MKKALTTYRSLIRPEAIIILFTLCVSLALPLAAGVYIYRQDLKPKPDDEISVYLRRYDKVKKTLKPGDVVGYIAESDLTIGERDKRLFLTQYEMSPVLVVLSTDIKTVIGNFESPASGKKTIVGKPLVVVKDFGNGVMILRNKRL